MKTAISTILLLTSCLSFLHAQVERYAFGDSIFVWASSLNMREGPSPNSKIVGKAPYGSAVVIVDDSIGKVAYRYKAIEAKPLENGEKSKPYYLNGFWVKVNFDGTVGYVFDGYLSKLKTFSSFKKDYGYDLYEWGTEIHHLKLYKIHREGEDASRAYKKEYGDLNSPIRVLLGCEKCGCLEIRLKNVSLEEGKMLGLQIFRENSIACETSVFFEKGYLIIYRECCC